MNAAGANGPARPPAGLVLRGAELLIAAPAGPGLPAMVRIVAEGGFAEAFVQMNAPQLRELERQAGELAGAIESSTLDTGGQGGKLFVPNRADRRRTNGSST